MDGGTEWYHARTIGNGGRIGFGQTLVCHHHHQLRCRILDQQRNKVAAIPLAIALDTANFVKEGGQDTCVWVANTGEGISQSSSIEANAEELAKLLTISIDDARKIVEADYIFSD